MANKPFKFRFANELAGGFILLAVAVVVLAVAASGRVRDLFTRTTTVTLALPPDGSLGLREGAEVNMLGTPIGNVRDVGIGDDGRMTATITVKTAFLKFIRQDSGAFIRTRVIGEAYVEIKRGTGAPLSETDPTLAVAPDVAATELAETLLRDLRDKALPAVDKLREAADEYTLLARDLRSPDGDLKQAIVRLNRIADKADTGDGIVARLLNDRSLSDQIVATGPKVNAALDETQATLRNLNKTSAALPGITASVNDQLKQLPGLVRQMEQTLAETQAVLTDVRKTTSQLPQTVTSVNRTVEGLPALVVQAQETLRQTQRTVEGMQRSWLVRGGMDADAPGGRINADRVGGGGGR